METLAWNDRYMTGLPPVDERRRGLAGIVGRLGATVRSGDGAPDVALAAIFGELAGQARRHFVDEEALMAGSGLDARHVDAHKRHHRDFIEQMLLIWRLGGQTANAGEALHDFAAAWLTMHFLGEDQAMARQIGRLRAGGTAAEAFEAEAAPEDGNAAASLRALGSLCDILMRQNRQLASANTALDERVAEGGRQLAEANERLEREQSEMIELLGKIDEVQGQLSQSDKMAAIGQLAAGVAHEINNPVGFVTSNFGALKGYVGKLLAVVDAYEQAATSLPERDRERIAAARTAADMDFLREDVVDLLRESEEGLTRVRKIVQDLKNFSRVDESEIQEADINAGIESTLNVVWNELKYKAEVVKDYGQLPPVRCVPAQINQVFMNMLVNAAQAIEERGTITIRSRVEGDWVWVEIADTGAGMPADVRRRIFEPFYTTKPVGKGTGLGLSISYDIVVKRHHGQIDVSSEPGQGTTFRVTLPLRQ